MAQARPAEPVRGTQSWPPSETGPRHHPDRLLPLQWLTVGASRRGGGRVHPGHDLHGAELRHRLPGRHDDPHRKHHRLDIGDYRQALDAWVSATCPSPSVRPVLRGHRHVAMVASAPRTRRDRLSRAAGRGRAALQQVDPQVTFASVESVDHSVGRANPHRHHGGGGGDRGHPSLHLAAVRMAVRGRRRVSLLHMSS